MSKFVGSWKAKSDVGVRLNNCVFTLSKNAIVAVKQESTKNRQVLVEFGPRDIDWMSNSFLNQFEKLS